MYKQLLLASTLSMGLIAAPSAMAGNDDHSRGYDRDRGRGDVVNHRQDGNGRYDRHDRHDRNDRDHRHDHNDRWDGHRADGHGWRHEREHRWKGPRYRAATYYAPRGYSRHSWRAGERLPYGYRATRYVVNDYRHYNLYAPPRGHHWVRVDRDVVLTAVATGVVAAVVYDLFF
jgi:Ni/Co efflux regulator RcnB